MLIFILQEATYLLSQTGQENIRIFIIACSLTVEAAGKNSLYVSEKTRIRDTVSAYMLHRVRLASKWSIRLLVKLWYVQAGLDILSAYTCMLYMHRVRHTSQRTTRLLINLWYLQVDLEIQCRLMFYIGSD